MSGTGGRLVQVASRPCFLRLPASRSGALALPTVHPCMRRNYALGRARVGSRQLAVNASAGPQIAQETAAFAERLASQAASSGRLPAVLVQPVVGEVSEGLETPIQLLYLLTLLGFLAAGAYLVVRQLLIRNELDQAAKELGERIRTGAASCEDYFELGVILTRKKLYTQATKNLEKAKKTWDGEGAELAQVHNALGFCYFQMGKDDAAVLEYRKALELQPGYVTAWNNLGDVYEKGKNWGEALRAYQEALSYAPNNNVAQQRAEFCKTRLDRRAA